MALVTRSVEVEAPVEMIWQWLTDPERVLEWNTQFLRYSIIEAVPEHVGTRYVTVEKFRGTILRNDCAVTEWQQHEKFGFRGDSAEFTKEGAYTIAPGGKTCLVTLAMTLTPKGSAMKKAASKLLIEKPYEVEVVGILEDLKSAIEAAYHQERVVRL
jgi:uncharacterized protein YndB with AHSA1/START domain